MDRSAWNPSARRGRIAVAASARAASASDLTSAMIAATGRATRRAVVLGGGSFAASAWESGLLAGMASAGVDLRDSDLFIGTSAGARVALPLANGTDLNELFEQQFKPIPNLPSPPPPDWPSIR